MKKTTRIFLVLLLASMIMSCIGFGALAADIQSENIAYGNEMSGKLEALRTEHYAQKQTGDPYGAEIATCNVILGYKTDIEGMAPESEVDRRADMYLLYNKGVAAGVLSWIYFSHNDVKDVVAISDVYTTQMGNIDNADISFFELQDGKIGVEECYQTLLNAIYAYKINALAEEGDSSAVKEIISGKENTLGSECQYIAQDENGRLGEDADLYKEYYANTQRLVEIQRNKDKTNAQMKDVFNKIHPNQSFETSEYLSKYRSSLNIKTTAASMNTLMYDTVKDLLDGLAVEGADFRNEYLTTKIAEVDTAVKSANGAETVEIAQIAAIFDSYTLELYSSDAKDTLTEYAKAEKEENKYGYDRLETVDGIVSEYTETDGYFDSAASEDLVDTELDRAKTRLDWFDIYCQKVDDGIGAYGGDHSEALAKAAAQYKATDEAIRDGERDGDGALSVRLATDIEALDGFVTEAEVIEFLTDHKDIIEKTEINAGDKTAISNALLDAVDLSDGAETLLHDTLVALAEKYKTATKDGFGGYLTDDEAKSLRDEVFRELSDTVDGLSVKNSDGEFVYEEFLEKADSLANKAEHIDGLLDVYVNDYLSVGEDTFSEEALDTVNTANRGIIDTASGDEDAIKEEAISEIWRLAALEKIYAASESYEEVDGVGELLEKAKTEIERYDEKTAIDAYAEKSIEELTELVRLDRAEKACGELEKYSDEIKKILSDYKYITDEQKQDLLDELKSITDSGAADISSAENTEKIAEELDAAKALLDVLANDADRAEKAACLADAKNVLKECYGQKEDYSAENYAKILELVGEYTDKLDKADTVAEYETIRNDGIKAITAVENKLETAQRLGAERLTEAYEELMQKKQCYSAENLARLEEIYTHSLSELSMFTKVSELDKANALVDERIALMRGVYLDRLYTDDRLFAQSSDPDVPEGYSPNSNGYSGAITSNGGILPDMKLVITDTENEGIAELIQNAAKKKSVYAVDGGEVAKDILKKLRKCQIIAAVDIDLGGNTVSGKEYTVSLLLPEGTDISEIFGVVFVDENGGVEFLEITSGETKIDFTTGHFSKYYVVSRGEVNLLPWIICLSIILLCEVIIVGILLFRRRKKNAEAALYSIAAPILLYVRYTPAGGKLIVTVLGIAVVALGAAIGYLLYLEFNDIKKKKAIEAKKEPVPVMAGPSAEPVEEPITESHSEPILLPQVSAPLASVTVEEAEELMTDGAAMELQSYEYDDKEIYRGAKRAEINIDTISQMFADGDTVTLNSLKEKKLVGQSVGFVKVLARGTLDKSLTVVAQDFSAAATKMIFLTGGTAVVTHASKEREARK